MTTTDYLIHIANHAARESGAEGTAFGATCDFIRANPEAIADCEYLASLPIGADDGVTAIKDRWARVAHVSAKWTQIALANEAKAKL